MTAERVWEVLIPQINDIQSTLMTAASIALYNPEVYPLIFVADDQSKKNMEQMIDDMAEEDDSMSRIVVRIYKDN